MYYEHKKHDGSLPLVGVNTFLPKEHAGDIVTEIELIRSTPEEKGQQIDNVATYQQLRNDLALSSFPRSRGKAGMGASETSNPNDPNTQAQTGLTYLQKTARERQNVFAALMEAVKTHSLGQISHALYDVGGEYRRNM